MNDQETDLLRRLQLGELGGDEDVLRRAMERSPELRRKVEEVMLLERQLMRLGEEHREDVRGAIEETSEEDRGVAARVLAEVAAAPPMPARRPLPRILLWGGLAAAAALIAAVLLSSPDEEAVDPGVDDRSELLGTPGEASPVGEVSRFGRFEHSRQPELGKVFVFRIWDAESEEGSPPLLESEPQPEASWEPALPEDHEWPQRIRWELRLVHEWSGQEESLGVFHARLRP